MTFSSALYFYCGTVFDQRRLSKGTVMSKNFQSSQCQMYIQLYSVILEYKQTQEIELIGKLTIIVIGWVKNT